MADAPVQPPAALKSLERDYRVKATEVEAVIEKLLQLVSAKEAECENLKYDLQDQTESRRHWHKRATEAESRLSSVQHVMILFDGNHHFFNPNLVRAGIQGAKSAIDSLVAEASAFAREQHKNDLPDHLAVVVHIFIDVGKLADDLSIAGLLPNPDQLWTFIQNVSRLEPGVTISDCGSGHHAVEAKMKYFYELYLENCHCRHLFLALNRQSEYFKILETYVDDEYTKSKTSLVRLRGGMANGYNLPFHTVDFSVIEAVPQQGLSFTTTNPQTNGTASGLSTAQQHGDISTQPLPNYSSNSKPFLQSAPPSRPVLPPASPENPSSRTVANMQKLSATASQTSTKPHVEVNGEVHKLDDSSSVGVVKLDNSSHSSRQSKAAEQSWENAPTNSYAPPAIAVPWGEEKTQPGQVMDEEPVLWRRQNNIQNRKQKLGYRKQERPSNAQTPRQTPRHFEGSWDDMVQSQQPKASTQVSSPSPAPASVSVSSAAAKSNDFSPAFTRQALTKPDPTPLARPVWSPVALNQLGQRIDLKLPRETPSEREAFEVRVANRQLCNEHHMRNNCTDTKCPFDHEEISDGIYLALRNIARTKPCSQGPECRRHDCYSGHHCPNISKFSTCARIACVFDKSGLHSIVDLEIVEMIQPPEKSQEEQSLL
ncbi:uncharacterized protein Z520_02129 [Fonsecaea multimorphosa CBS 102226]|uniref:C3H1-type domain-containing protein n=1 Tax=Fonsecaea multimorphosa CBS 102226 TaxID=1442371 RepID=A0A0D2HJC9_9EURO|nr:uncharacterized protein Z520_02129 [Fonsecaea multimorphosa CBS 102226]KIY01991.1 hypothetical protein Z520_02129 [Fonsecaea multimorphosa CBS 102226]OAL29672.1 hypothetical protein AYO22_02086 [Fonsecaea multimorphosa]